MEDRSGFGGCKTYKIWADGADPHAVAFHCRMGSQVEDDVSDWVIEQATKALAEYDCTPARLAEGEYWYMEPWEGCAAG